jgi:HEAT repeat protein
MIPYRSYLPRLVLFIPILSCAIPLAGQDPDRAAPPADTAFHDVLSYEHGQNRKAALALEKLVGDSLNDHAARKALAIRLAGLLGNPKATLACKEVVCKQIMRIGGAEAVPALAKLIGNDENLAFLGRYALERIPDPAAAAALRDALSRTKGRVRVGVINSLGAIRDPQVVPLLTPLLSDPDADAAANTLGKIGGDQALSALRALSPQASPSVRAAADDALLAIADRLLAGGKKGEAAAIYEPLLADNQQASMRAAALKGFAAAKPDQAVPRIAELLAGPDPQMFHAALQLVRTCTGKQADEVFPGQLAKLPDERKPLLIEALADRSDAKSPSPASLGDPPPITVTPLTWSAARIFDAYEGGTPAVRLAVLKALAAVNAVAKSSWLIDAAVYEKDAALKEGAFQSLIILRGPSVDAEVLDRLKKTKGPSRIVLLRALTLRRAPAAIGELLKAAADKDPAIKAEALALLQRIVSDKDVPALVKVLLASKPGNSRTAAEQALYACCLAIPDAEKRLDPLLALWQDGDPKTRAAILPVLGRFGCPKALDAIHAALKEPDETLHEAGMRGIANWPDATVADELMQIAKTTHKPADRSTALRAFARVVAKPSGRPPQETFALLKQALDLSESAGEKSYILSRFSGARSPEALQLVVSYLDDPAVQSGAAAAAVGLADRLKLTNREQALKALEKVLQVTKDEALHTKTVELQRRIRSLESEKK